MKFDFFFRNIVSSLLTSRQVTQRGKYIKMKELENLFKHIYVYQLGLMGIIISISCMAIRMQQTTTSNKMFTPLLSRNRQRKRPQLCWFAASSASLHGNQTTGPTADIAKLSHSAGIAESSRKARLDMQDNTLTLPGSTVKSEQNSNK